MNIIPIQVTDEGVLIPKTYLHNASEIDVVTTGDYFLIKPRQLGATQPPSTLAAAETPVPRAPVNPPPVNPSVVNPPSVNQPAVNQPPVNPPRRNPLISSTRSRNPQRTTKAETFLENEADRHNFTLQDGKPGSEFDLDT